MTTVGYGDIVPKTGWGRTIAGVLMITGIGFLAVITASVTAALVESARARLPSASSETITPEPVREIVARLEAIESRLHLNRACGLTADPTGSERASAHGCRVLVRSHRERPKKLMGGLS